MLDGYKKEIKFGNGYGLSIVSHSFSYGGERGLFEIALIDLATDEIVYNSELGFSDVIGYLDFHHVVEVIERVKNHVRV